MVGTLRSAHPTISRIEARRSCRHCERSEAIHSAASREMDCFVASLLAMTNFLKGLAYFTVSAPALQATASWSPVAPLQPTAPMILPLSTSGKPPGDAVGGGESSVAI